MHLKYTAYPSFKLQHPEHDHLLGVVFVSADEFKSNVYNIYFGVLKVCVLKLSGKAINQIYSKLSFEQKGIKCFTRGVKTAVQVKFNGDFRVQRD